MKRILPAVLLACSLVAARADQLFNISLSGLNEVGPTASPATGSGTASFDPIAVTISVNLFFSGLTAPATASHIHLGAAGVNGGVIVSTTTFTPAATSGSIATTSLTFPSANVTDLLAGNTYFNIHTANYPGGEIRGQLVPVPEPSTLALGGLGIIALVFKRRRQ